MQEYFYNLSRSLFDLLTDNEVLGCYFEGEAGDFVRFNNNKIRQAGHVNQLNISIHLIIGEKHLGCSVQLSGIEENDHVLLLSMLETLRSVIPQLPEDPFLNFSREVNNTEEKHTNELPGTDSMVSHIMSSAKGMDMVGILANGVIYNGYCNSMGQKNWHSSNSFNFDWSCYYESDKAVKNNYSGHSWSQEVLDRYVDNTKQQLEIIKKPPIDLNTGKYRIYLAPSALKEITDMMSWNGFSLKGHQTRQTPLLKMITEDKRLSPLVNIVENNKNGLAPCFTQEGFIIPGTVELIRNGQYANTLANARSAREYGQSTNCDEERPVSLEMAAGTIKNDKIYDELDSGIYINNLWYCNFSDYNNCRITGMTRFACFWVDKGKPVAPVSVMRFDETVYNILGSKLSGITQYREQLIDPDSYENRSSSSSLLPGIIVDDFSLTL